LSDLRKERIKDATITVLKCFSSEEDSLSHAFQAKLKRDYDEEVKQGIG
jgi:hypothetical protein